MPRVPVAGRMQFVLLCALLVSRSASAQLSPAGILGAARDTSGGVLPGVTVEAASPALIEKVRTVVTDDQGRFNIVDLRPGAYTVTFTLPDFWPRATQAARNLGSPRSVSRMQPMGASWPSSRA